MALIGPLASAPGEMLGPWASAGRAEEAVSILDGLEAALPQCRIDYGAGVDVDSDDAGLPAALDLPRRRGRHAMPWRGRPYERRSGEPRRHRAAGTPARTRRGGSRTRQAGRGVTLFRPPARSALALRARGRGARGLVSGRRGRQRRRRRPHRQIQPDGTIAGDLAAPRRAGPDLLRRAPSGRPERRAGVTRAPISIRRRRRNSLSVMACPTAGSRCGTSLRSDRVRAGKRRDVAQAS